MDELIQKCLNTAYRIFYTQTLGRNFFFRLGRGKKTELLQYQS